MNRTDIEYLDYTWNPLAMRCTPISEGCAHCWHIRMAKRLAGNAWFPNHIREAWAGKGPPVYRLNELEAPLELRKTSRIGVQLMGDLFHSDVPFMFKERMWDVMEQTPQHTYIVLTKRAERMLGTLDELQVSHGILPNVWLGVSAENEPRLNERWPLLQKTPAAVRFLSLEPLLDPIDLCVGDPRLREPDWVIVGAETGPGARPMDPLWAMDIRDQCYRAGVPFFIKKMSNGAPIPDDLMVREWPPAVERQAAPTFLEAQ